MNRDLIHVFTVVAPPVTDIDLLGNSRNVELNAFMLYLLFRNPPATPQGANKVNRDPSQRVHNLNYLVQQIKTYYLVSVGCFLHWFFQPYDMLYNAFKL